MADPSDPLRNATRVAKAEAAFRARLVATQRAALEYVKGVYSFELVPEQVASIADDIRDLIQEGINGERWLFESYVQPSYAAGASRAWSNLSVQSEVYKTAFPQFASLLMSQPYQTRLALTGARVFEEMEGFAGDLGNKLAATLTRSVTDGLGARDVAKQIKQNFDVSESRALRIARTEANTALNRAILDESEAAAASVGLESKVMHISAFMPTSRLTHIERHGTLHTAQEQREWWSRDANAINCMCSSVPVLLAPDGKPLAPGLIARAQQIKEEMTQ